MAQYIKLLSRVAPGGGLRLCFGGGLGCLGGGEAAHKPSFSPDMVEIWHEGTG